MSSLRKLKLLRVSLTKDFIDKNMIKKPVNGFRVLIQPYIYDINKACGLIDRGIINGYIAAGCDVFVWRDALDPSTLESVLAEFQPTHFVAFLQLPNRSNSSWTSGHNLRILEEYKRSSGLKVIVNSFPSNLRDMYGDWVEKARHHFEAGVSSFYLQEERPNLVEQKVIQSGIIDLMTTSFCIENAPILYKNFIECGIPILEEPPAADASFYNQFVFSDQDQVEDVLYIGNSWSFKYENMGPFVEPMKRHFQERFHVYGDGWPDGISNGVIPNGDADLFVSHVGKSRISLAFHEPSQVLGFPTNGNERVFKLLYLGAFVISDPCGTLGSYFDLHEHLCVVRTGKEMIEACEYYLAHDEERKRISNNAREWVSKHHTYQNRAQRVLDLTKEELNGLYPYRRISCSH